jgi:putative tryptophan/tyrosine transport system substrate-binding protein
MRHYRAAIWMLLTVVPLTALCQGPEQAMIAVLKSAENSIYDQAVVSFSEGCRARVTVFKMNGSLQTGREQIEVINSGKYRMVLAIGASAALVARERSKHPVVFCAVFSPDRGRLTGNNITGVTLDASVKEQFSALQKMMPGLKTIGVIYDPRVSSDLIREARSASKGLGLHLETREVSSHKEVTWAVRDLMGLVEAQWVIADSTVVNAENLRHMLLTSVENKVPILAFSDAVVREGALASVSSPKEDIGDEAAGLANRILNGELISTLPIRCSRRAVVFINLKTAKSIKLSIPSDVLSAARVGG